MLLGCEVLTKKGLQRTALASFHSLSMHLYYIYALRRVGTARKMSGSHWGKGILNEFFLNAGEKIKCKLGVFPSAHVEENKFNFHTDFQELISIWQVVIVLSCQIA